MTKKLPWVSTKSMKLQLDEPIKVPEGLVSSRVINSLLPFIATTRLGPKDVEWDIAGLYIPSEDSDKIMLW